MQGYRNQPPADIDAVADVLVRLSQLVANQATLAELDINPLLANPEGAIGLDARLRVRATTQPGSERLAIRPYPKEFESGATLADGTRLHFRPVHPEDEPRIQDMVARCSPEDLRLRFFTPMRGLSHEMAARLSQIDYDREMGLVAEAARARRDLGRRALCRRSRQHPRRIRGRRAHGPQGPRPRLSPDAPIDRGGSGGAASRRSSATCSARTSPC
jgi:acetyltransferase